MLHGSLLAVAMLAAAATESVLATQPAKSVGLGVPRGIVVDEQGRVYVAAEELGRVFRVDPSGSLTILASGLAAPCGVALRARFLRMGRYREAESYYKKIVERYEDQGMLDQFYVRYEQRIGDGRYRTEAQEALKRLFPQGLQRAALGDLGAPPTPGKGYLVTWKPGPGMTRVGLQTRDVVVAVDGYRVNDEEEYETVWGFTDKRDIALIVWRGGRYLELKGQVRREPHGPAATSRTVA